ncbi:MAG: ester cyclase [Altibacter sp.]|uniref:ester cyclase n=1 Tax=Altibacter sp. TaxID=2024823 RepID=UPI001DED0AFB|nr:ester cyclase [Altibacter sp.]MBZ0327936.1 ester cyclase [Altibacter sp.]
MKTTIKLLFVTALVLLTACNNPNKQVEDNITKYTTVWDEIINEGKLDLINDTNFDPEITLITNPENVVGIEAFKDYYSNFTTGFSNPDFTIVDIFGQGDKLVKHWKFKGTHSGDFFGIPATGKAVEVEGSTIAVMKDGKIAQEQDFMDNLAFMAQLGIDPLLNADNITVVSDLYTNFGKGDVPAVLAALDAKVEWNEAEGNALADGNPYIGPDAVLKGVFERVIAAYENFTLNDIKLHNMENEQVLATLRYKGKVKATGKSINAQAAHLWTLKDGKVIAFQQYVDTKQLHETGRN